MAITITKQPEGIYPAYNDSFIEFNSTLTDNVRAEITLFPIEIFSRPFVIYPNSEGNYLFNLKEAVKVIFNTDGFKDANFDTGVYWKSATGLLLTQEMKIEVFSNTTSEQITDFFDFYKAVKQVGELLHSNEYQILTNTPDGINHSLSYFDGFPFSFDIQKVIYDANREITIKNINTGFESGVMKPSETGAFRINIDRGNGRNWTNDGFLPLIEGLNKLEIYEDGVFKSNLDVYKKRNCSGIYLKWWNTNGGFTHYLFDEFYISQNKSSNIGDVFSGEFNNVNESVGNRVSIGKESNATIAVKAKYKKRDYENMIDLLNSPFVQMYSAKNPDIEGHFINVSIDGTLTNSNKKLNNEASIIIDLPTVNTAKL